MSEREFWKYVKNYEGLYQVSNLGNFRKKVTRINQYVKVNVGDFTPIKPRLHNAGYLCVSFYKDGIKKDFLAHRLVAQTFFGNSKLHVNHKDCNKHNNRIDNLEWVTRKENTRHAFKTKGNFIAKGESQGKSKFLETDIHEIRRMHKSKIKNITEIANMYSVNYTAIWKIINRKTWKHI